MIKLKGHITKNENPMPVVVTQKKIFATLMKFKIPFMMFLVITNIERKIFMKYILVLIIICSSFQGHAQKYILLDKAISQPAFYNNKILVSEEYKGFIPVENKDILKFMDALEEIAQRLTSKKITGKAKSYKFGCTELNGVAFPLASGERLDYVLTSTCENSNITMHLCDAKLSNEDNAYYIKTWIKYIRSEQKQNQRLLK